MIERNMTLTYKMYPSYKTSPQLIAFLLKFKYSCKYCCDMQRQF
jgi:hypothetical protein